MQLRDFFRYYRSLPHQDAAIQKLQESMPAALLSRDAEWYRLWQAGGRQSDLAPALKIIKQFEGCRLDAYPDPASGGEPWTIGYGTTRYDDGRRVRPGDKINMIEADLLLRREIDEIAKHLRGCIPFWNEMTDGQQSALVSFAYNLGTYFYGGSGFATISRYLRERNWADVPKAFMLYINPGTNVEAGLRRRREAEGKLWAS